MTVCVRNEQDIIRAFVDYHLARGVDHILVRDTGSADLTPRFLAEYRTGGRVSVTEAPTEQFDQGAWATEMAQRAHHQHRAEFVLHADADEFWWPRGGDLKTAFAAVPPQAVTVAVGRSNFLLCPDDVGRWWERLTIRDLTRLNCEGRPLHPKVCHRAQPGLVVDHGAMAVHGPGAERTYRHDGLEILHFPARTRAQLTRKVQEGALALSRTPGLPDGVGSTWRALAEEAGTGRLAARLDGEALRAGNAARGTRAGAGLRDLRLARHLHEMQRAGTLGRGEVAVIVPVYGQHHLTAAVVEDLRRQDGPHTVYVVDNGGDYQPTGGEFVVRPGENLHWAGGCNLGMLVAQDQGHDGYVLLNNDVRLCPGFLSGLLAAWKHSGGDLVGPVYDRNWPQQRTGFTGPAADYVPRPAERRVPFLDGTCLLVPHDTLRTVGLIDAQTWPRYGWGCDKDYALRVRRAAGHVHVTERAYLNHLGRQTAAAEPWYDEADAEHENDTGMATKWGQPWRELLYAGFADTPRNGLVQQRLADTGQAPRRPVRPHASSDPGSCPS